MKTTLQKIVERRAVLGKQRKTKINEHRAYLERIDGELAALDVTEKQLLAGIDVARTERARGIVKIIGDISKSRTAWNANQASNNQSIMRHDLAREASEDVAAGCAKIHHRYFGVKNYSHFGDQREDHQYGYGPKHGHIVFAIGLTNEARERLDKGEKLSPQETEDALYLIASLPRIAEALATEVA